MNSDETTATTKTRSSSLWETARTIVYAVLIALVVRTFFYEPFNIPSGSMIPTLLIGDYLFVSKYAYGYSRYSLPWSVPLIEGRMLADTPERGDVAVFKLPADNRTDYIKRIVGLPGDDIQVVDGVLHINGEAVEREKVKDLNVDGGLGFPIRVTQYIETLPNEREHYIWEYGDAEAYDNTGVYHVPEGHYFAMGDNRDRSLDSRSQSRVGFVPFENLVGRAEFIFFSHEDEARFWEIWKWPQVIRFGRIGHGIE